MTKRLLTMAVAAALLLGTGCKPRTQEITPAQRKEALGLVSEAKFAWSVHDGARAEASLVKATELCPDVGDYWLELGRCRVRIGNRSTAKDAYKSALAAYKADAARNEVATRGRPTLGQIYILALLGQIDDARALLAKAQKEMPDSRELREFAEKKGIDQLVASAEFKEVAL